MSQNIHLTTPETQSNFIYKRGVLSTSNDTDYSTYIDSLFKSSTSIGDDIFHIKTPNIYSPCNERQSIHIVISSLSSNRPQNEAEFVDLYGTLSEGRGNYYLHYKSGLRTSKPGSPLFIPSETLCRLFIEAVETNVDDLGFVTAPQIEWSSDPFEAAAEYLQDVTEGYLANLAFKGSALGIAGIKISKANGQFYPKFASDLLDCLALNPYSTEIFLDLLHNEIAASTKNRPFRKEWGELFLVPSGLLLISKAKVSVEKRSHPPVEVISDEDLKARYPPEAYQGDPGSHE